ncbi:MAG: Hint domain-containing protein [Herpetosiphonaceae bacterium]|nr:Hint domain-containing protein [Herpetosiphonaceae bacterium]
MRKRLIGLCALVLLLAQCGTPTMPSAPASSTVPLGKIALSYRLRDFLTSGRGMAAVDWCDYEYYPLHHMAGFEERAQSAIQDMALSDPAGLQIIQQTTGLITDITTLNITQTLALYYQIRSTDSIYLHDYIDERYQFTAHIKNDIDQTIRVEGTITNLGAIEIQSQEPEYVMCPTCLAANTLIATPGGAVPVQQLRAGDIVWTATPDGTWIAAPILRVSRSAVPPQHQVARVTLSDGRRVTASLRHPTSDGRLFAELNVGEQLDGGTISRIEQADYAHGWTYDLLPEGATGWYWADGVLLASTLRDLP